MGNRRGRHILQNMVEGETLINIGKFIITQIIYLNEGGQKDFQEYESLVLPLLEKYKGKLEFRIRPAAENFIYPIESELPYELHIVSFETKADFLKFKDDPVRTNHHELFQRAVKRVVVLESDTNNNM